MNVLRSIYLLLLDVTSVNNFFIEKDLKKHPNNLIPRSLEESCITPIWTASRSCLLDKKNSIFYPAMLEMAALIACQALNHDFHSELLNSHPSFQGWLKEGALGLARTCASVKTVGIEFRGARSKIMHNIWGISLLGHLREMWALAFGDSGWECFLTRGKHGNRW